jgi:dTDP-L-rhamnose 4-epimerase
VRVLVTGGAGFVGSHVVDALVAGGHEAVVVDRAVPAEPNPTADYRAGDVRDRRCWDGLLDGVDAVCHQAARVGLGVDPGDVVDYVSDNDVGTAELLLALHRSRFAGRLVLAGSMVVYGEGVSACAEHGVVRPSPRRPADLDAGRFEPRCPVCGAPVEPCLVDEEAPCDPRNVYAATKLHQEHLCTVFGRQAGIPVTVLRYHNVYGPRMPAGTPYAGVASIFAGAVAAGRPPRVFEDGGQRRDFVHVTDVARANVLALTAHPPVEGPLNVASGDPRTVLDLASAFASGRGETVRPVVTGAWRPGDVRHVVASPVRARRLLGFSAQVPFAAGMAALAAPSGSDPRAPAGVPKDPADPW